MALSRVKTWSAGEVLTASDLNSEFNNILGNALSLISPLTGALDLDGNSLTLDAAAATSVVSSTAVSWNFTSGAKTGTPATTGTVSNWSAQTFTDSATAGSGTATAFVAHSFQRPTLAATNASVVTTDAATLYVANAPAAGTNETLTNSYALWTDDGRVRHDLTASVVSAAGATLDALNLTAATATISGSTNITTATGMNFMTVGRPTLSAASALTVSSAATLYVSNSPAAAGAGPATITDPWSIWVDDGNVRLDGQICGIGSPVLHELRLTLSSGLPVTITDVTAAGTLYLTPYGGSHITLYDGSIWKTFSTAEISLALTLTSGKPYDIFCFISSGAPALEALVWTNDTTRATALTTQNGVLVKTGATTRRYLGTIYSSGANTTEDSVTKRYLWNYHHRIERTLFKGDSTDTWTYSTDSWRAANNNTANSVAYVCGVAEDAVIASYSSSVVTAAVSAGSVGVGVDSSTVNSAQMFPELQPSLTDLLTARYEGVPSGVGLHTIYAIERVRAAGTVTYAGDNGQPNNSQYGISVRVKS